MTGFYLKKMKNVSLVYPKFGFRDTAISPLRSEQLPFGIPNPPPKNSEKTCSTVRFVSVSQNIHGIWISRPRRFGGIDAGVKG
jgi:hypothetical protein